jgi:hypothetical protein
MEQQDAEIADVVVILADPLPLPLEEATQQLKSAGLAITDIDADNGAIEGTLNPDLIKMVQAMAFVKYVRKIFEYTVEPPSGDDCEDNEDEFK